MGMLASLDHPSSIPYGISLADPTIIMVHDLACFCVACFKEEQEGCLNKAHVFSWQLIKLKPSNTKLVREQKEEFDDLDVPKFGGDGEGLFDLL